MLVKSVDEMIVDDVRVKAVDVSWLVRDFGFGQIYFYYKDGQLYCDNEMMSKEFIKKILCAMVDSCELDS